MLVLTTAASGADIALTGMTRLFQSFKLTSTMAPTMNGEFSNAVGPDWVTSEASTGVWYSHLKVFDLEKL